MGKLVLVSVMFALVAIPAFVSRDPRPRRGLRKAVLYVIAFNVFYLLALRFLMPRLGY